MALSPIEIKNTTLTSTQRTLYALQKCKIFTRMECNVHGINDVWQTEMYIVKPFVPEPSSFQVEVTIENLERYKPPSIVHILAELVHVEGNKLCCETHELTNSV